MKLFFFLAGVLLGGCGDAEPSDACIFDGRYEIGYLERNGCGSTSEQFTAVQQEDTCSTQIDQLSLAGVWQSGLISCPPGDPVVECDGFMNDANGCSWDIYIRRVTSRP